MSSKPEPSSTLSVYWRDFSSLNIKLRLSLLHNPLTITSLTGDTHLYRLNKKSLK